MTDSTMTKQLTIQPAQADQIQALNSLAYLSKAHWQYSTSQLESWRDILTISAEIAAGEVYAGSIGANLVSMFTLVPAIPDYRLDHFFVSPGQMNRGIGKQMWRYAMQLAFDLGARAVLIDADPNAEPFYLACGALRVGEIAAPIKNDTRRVRPQLIYHP